MRRGRTVVFVMLLLATVYATLSPQSVVDVWAYKTVRAVSLVPQTKYGGTAERVRVVARDVGTGEAQLVRELSEEALDILEGELGFKPHKTVVVVVDAQLSEQNMVGYYQLGQVVVETPARLGMALYKQKGPVLHELTHLAVDYLAHGNYPMWLSEGLAQYMEYKHKDYMWFDNNAVHAWQSLEHVEKSFANDNRVEAAYWQSLVVVTYLYEQGGGNAMSRFLKDLGRGEQLVNALERAYGIALADIERDALVSFLRRQEAVRLGRIVRDEVSDYDRKDIGYSKPKGWGG